jgi:hypothetical protein
MTLFYWPPGHNVKVDADAEIVMFSPQREHSHVIKHMIEKPAWKNPGREATSRLTPMLGTWRAC